MDHEENRVSRKRWPTGSEELAVHVIFLGVAFTAILGMASRMGLWALPVAATLLVLKDVYLWGLRKVRSSTPTRD